MTKINQIDKEALEDILKARAKATELTAVAENAVKDAKAAKTEFDLALAHLFLGHNLNRDCKIDMSTGVVTWPEETVEQAIDGVADAIVNSAGFKEKVEELAEKVTAVTKDVLSKKAKTAKKSKKVK